MLISDLIRLSRIQLNSFIYWRFITTSMEVQKIKGCFIQNKPNDPPGNWAWNPILWHTTINNSGQSASTELVLYFILLQYEKW